MKIRETKVIPEGVMGIAAGRHTRVRALHYYEDGVVPEGAEAVPDETPVSDWALELDSDNSGKPASQRTTQKRRTAKRRNPKGGE